MRRFAPRLALVGLFALPIGSPNAIRADEFKLKDGTTISGAIVGFDENAFRVQTSYGFALVRKDQVVSIRISDGKPALPEKNSDVSLAAPVSAAPVPVGPNPKPVISPEANAYVKPVDRSEDKPAKKPVPAPVFAAPPPPRVIASAPLPEVTAPTRAANSPQPPVRLPEGMQPTPVLVPASSSSAGTSLEPSASGAVPAPKGPTIEPIREEVEGNTYVNDTYRFHLYKPPTWHVLASARTVLPGAIAALGTDDESTYLLIGQEPAGKSLIVAAAQAQKRLTDVMDNFRAVGQQQIQVGNAWVTERLFRGGVAGQDWSGVVVLIPHGEHLFTVFGMTRADNDLVQIQENVIARAISSLEFVP